MKNKLLATATMVTVMVAVPGTAWADNCVNLSRGSGNAVPWETTRGRWTYIEPDLGTFWVFDTPENFQNGKGEALLDNSAACNSARLLGQTGGDVTIDSLRGIWSESCVDEAANFGG